MKIIFNCARCHTSSEFTMILSRKAVEVEGKVRVYLCCHNCNGVAPYLVSHKIYEELRETELTRTYGVLR